MGASSSSPRDLTVEEDRAEDAIKVSEAVARRLVGKPDIQPKVISEAPLTIEAKDEIQAEIQNLQSKYERKIKALEKQNKDLHQVSTEHFSKAVDEVEKKFLGALPNNPVCTELQEEVRKCYENNPKETLNCAANVKAYSACVQEQREKILTKSDEECQPCMLAQMARGPCGSHFMNAYDCYLDQGSEPEEKCGLLYLEMKECWEKYPTYGYQKIVDKAYSDSSKDEKADTSKKNNKHTETATESNEQDKEL